MRTCFVGTMYPAGVDGALDAVPAAEVDAVPDAVPDAVVDAVPDAVVDGSAEAASGEDGVEDMDPIVPREGGVPRRAVPRPRPSGDRGRASPRRLLWSA